MWLEAREEKTGDLEHLPLRLEYTRNIFALFRATCGSVFIFMEEKAQCTSESLIFLLLEKLLGL